MGERKRWSREELMIAMNLYCKLSFGQIHLRTPIIIEVAKKLGRTPSSLAMKLANFASLDPDLQARGIKGLQGASRADREIWQEFHGDWDSFGYASEAKLGELFDKLPTEIKSTKLDSSEATSKGQNQIAITEAEANVKIRIGQNFFRETILGNYYRRCCITSNPIPELLVASHILPWSKYPEYRLNPRNGLCLSKTQDAAFDKGLITVSSDYTIILSSYLRDFLPDKTLDANFGIYSNQPMNLPEKFIPDLDFLAYHREEIFIG